MASLNQYCDLEVKTLEGEMYSLKKVNVDSTIEDLYHMVNDLETFTDGTWKLTIVASGLKTLKLTEGSRKLKEFGVKSGQNYRVEVVLDMGGCLNTQGLIENQIPLTA